MLFTNSLYKSFIVTSLANYPVLLNASVSTFISCVVNASLEEIGFNADHSKVTANYPSRTTLSYVAMD